MDINEFSVQFPNLDAQEKKFQLLWWWVVSFGFSHFISRFCITAQFSIVIVSIRVEQQVFSLLSFVRFLYVCVPRLLLHHLIRYPLGCSNTCRSCGGICHLHSHFTCLVLILYLLPLSSSLFRVYWCISCLIGTSFELLYVFLFTLPNFAVKNFDLQVNLEILVGKLGIKMMEKHLRRILLPGKMHSLGGKLYIFR